MPKQRTRRQTHGATAGRSVGRELPGIDLDGFGAFWEAFPCKKAKAVARKAYAKARKGGVTLQTLLAGVEDYIANKPDWQQFCHASTWLNGERWEDCYERPVRSRYCPHEPCCRSFAACRALLFGDAREA